MKAIRSRDPVAVALIDPVDVPSAVDGDEVNCTLRPGPSLMNHPCRHVSEGAGIEHHTIPVILMLHDEGAADDCDRLIGRMPMPRHVRILRRSNDKLRCL